MRTHLLATGLLLLAACGKAPDNGANEAAPAAPAEPIKPGLYRQATTLIELRDPSLGPEEAAAAAKAIGTTQTAERCVTPEMVANPKEMVESSSEQGCTASKNLWDKGKIDIALSCPETADTSAGTMILTGTYGAEHYVMTMTMSGSGGEVMRMKVDGRRLGDCSG